MRIGDMVSCHAYIKPSGNHYEIIKAKDSGSGMDACFYSERGSETSEEVEDCHSCERYKTIEKEFSGVYVGTTTLCTRLNAEYFEDNYGGSGFRTYCDEPEKFAIVYYADNKKRIVPLDRLEETK